MSKRLPPMHPGEVLREEFLVPLKLSAGAWLRKTYLRNDRAHRQGEHPDLR